MAHRESEGEGNVGARSSGKHAFLLFPARKSFRLDSLRVSEALTECCADASDLDDARKQIGRVERKLSAADADVRELRREVWMLECGVSDGR